jgi:hypothetical protein
MSLPAIASSIPYIRPKNRRISAAKQPALHLHPLPADVFTGRAGYHSLSEISVERQLLIVKKQREELPARSDRPLKPMPEGLAANIF